MQVSLKYDGNLPWINKGIEGHEIKIVCRKTKTIRYNIITIAQNKSNLNLIKLPIHKIQQNQLVKAKIAPERSKIGIR